MVVQTNKFNMMAPPLGPTTFLESGHFVNGKRIDYRFGETTGAAYARHLATALATPVAKSAPAVDPQIADLRKRETEVAKLRQSADAKEQIGKLEKQVADLQSRRDTPKPRKGIRLSQDGFNVFAKPTKPAA